MKLFEGGNVFKDGSGRALTQRINQTDVKSTLAWLEELVPGLDLQNNTLGSTGIKDTSGDLDIAVDTAEVSKEQMVAQLTHWAQSQGFRPEDWVRKSGTAVHFKTPINGRPDSGFVQTDFMFLNNVPWSKFVLGAMPPDSQYKGRERNVLMNSIAKSLGYKLNQIAGIADRETNKIISDDPDAVAKMLLNRTATRQDLASVESILQALSTDPKRDAKLADFRQHMAREGLPFLESTELYQPVSDVYFLARLRDRIVNQGMQVIVEAEVQGGRAKGIEHLEDYVFRNGSAGIKKALDIVKHTVAATPKTTTVKWDGKPALVFGRDVNGTFVLTDVSGFGAQGYNGLFTSPRQVRQHLAARDSEAAAQGKRATRVQELAPIYDQLWPLLDAAVPKNYQGFFQGDLLYTETPPLEAGNYVFRPNEIEYKIPARSDVGQRIGASDVGIAMHTQYAKPGAVKEPIGNFEFKRVPGLLLLEPIYAKENVAPELAAIKQVRNIYNTQGAAIDQLFNPEELRALQITNLPVLCIDYINSRVGTNFDNLLAGFVPWLLTKFPPKTIRYMVKTGDTAIKIAEKYGIDPNSLKGQQIVPGQEIVFTVPSSKFRHIVEYLQSPRSNLVGMTAAFAAWELLHMIKMDLLGKLDLQHPGQEGWVMATDAGIAKAVNRLAGGFTAANRALNNPKQPA
jgi:hypothetical protein